MLELTLPLVERTGIIPRRSYHRTGCESYLTDSTLGKYFLQVFDNVNELS
jgi:hypothetical protein